VLLIPHPDFANHNGGQLQFGPDGDLYIGTGDGGDAGDSADNARHLNVLLGKLLRIDPRRHRRRAYTVPRDNPFVDRPGARPEIYSYGLRNPWRFSFDPATEAVAIGDVGQNSFEEVDYTTMAQTKGANFGWPQYEGDAIYDDSRPDPNPRPPKPAFPIMTYAHSGGCAVVGGYVVRAPDLPSLAGRYLYTDLCHGDIRSFVPSPHKARGNKTTGLAVRSPSSFGEGYRGRIYIASLSGPVYRLTQKR
jgi:glucose/arabinose dehydrogenase